MIFLILVIILSLRWSSKSKPWYYASAQNALPRTAEHSASFKKFLTASVAELTSSR